MIPKRDKPLPLHYLCCYHFIVMVDICEEVSIHQTASGLNKTERIKSKTEQESRIQASPFNHVYLSFTT
ncbi:unnamed protein product [Brugia timori]|uniref:Ovule protein n=1 Tax=Brugia timori TaxID=42155 RepID=A0A0R3R3W9_9BILA|nr:unnamed protein product [Brugia timori]